MSYTPSDPDYINEKAFERFVRSLDYALMRKYGLAADQQPKCEQAFIRKSIDEKRASTQPALRQSFWEGFCQTFPPFKAILRLRDDIRLRRYNREWLKNNIH